MTTSPQKASAILLYGYEKCDTCRKAYRFLESAGIAFEKRDITVHPPTREEIETMIDRQSGNFKKLFNVSGKVYRAENLADRMATMSRKQAVELLAANGRLVKRPFVLLEKAGLVGFQIDDWNRTFLEK